MSEMENKQEQKAKVSLWAKVSLCSTIAGLMLLFIPFLMGDKFLISILLIIFGFAAGIIGLINKKGKGQINEKRFEIIAIIISLVVPGILFSILAYGFYRIIRYESPYKDKHPDAVVKRVEEFGDVNFPVEMKQLKAAEKIATGLDHPYTFIIRFRTDSKSFAEFIGRLKVGKYYDDTYKEMVGDNEKSESYGSSNIGWMWQKNAPQWYNVKIPKDKNYGFCFIGDIVFDLIYETLPDSNEVEVTIEGYSDQRNNRALFNELKKKD